MSIITLVRGRHSTIAVIVVALLAGPTTAIAKRSPPPPVANGGGGSMPGAATILDCGGDGVTAFYCIPLVSTFSFTSVGQAAGCALRVQVRVRPALSASRPLKGHVHLVVRGTDAATRRVHKVARPPAKAGAASGAMSHVIGGLVSGRYRVTGWYEGDRWRGASTHGSRRITLHCVR